MNWKPKTIEDKTHWWVHYRGFRLHVREEHGVGSFMIKKAGTIMKHWGSGMQTGGLSLAKKQAVAYVDLIKGVAK